MYMDSFLEKPSKLYFDLEYDIPSNPNIDGPRLTTNFIQVILSRLEQSFLNAHRTR
jgi:hypothetical protein